MNHYKKALERIQKECGKVCEKYEICDHPSCQSSYNSWAIADEALKEKSIFRIWILGLIIITFIFLTFALIRIEKIEKINDRIEKQHLMLQKEVTDLEREKHQLKLEFESFKQMTSDEFVRTWESFGVIRNNFLALGTGKFLCDDDFASDDESDEQEKE